MSEEPSILERVAGSGVVGCNSDEDFVATAAAVARHLGRGRNRDDLVTDGGSKRYDGMRWPKDTGRSRARRTRLEVDAPLRWPRAGWSMATWDRSTWFWGSADCAGGY